MKYVKLFESWLNEAEGEDEIKNFNEKEPRDWPVMKTTIKMLYSGAGGNINIEVLESILGRANQKNNKKFDKNANIRLIGLGDGYGPTIDNDGRLAIKSDKAATGETRKDVQSMFKKIAKADAVKDNLSTGKTLRAFAITDGREIPAGDQIALTASREPNMCVIVLPLNIKDIVNKPDSEVINMNIMAIFDGNAYTTLMANLLAFIKDGLDTAQFFTEKEQYQNVSNIFAGETKGALIAFEKTIGEVRFIASTRDKDGQKDKIEDPIIITTPAKGTEYVGQIRFEFDDDKLTEAAKQTLQSEKLENKLLKAKKSIEIIGNADGMGNAEYNKKLSVRRADSVKNFLEGTLSDLIERGIKITATGVGFDNKIIDDNKGTDAAAATINRRVDFVIDGAKPDYSKIREEVKKMK